MLGVWQKMSLERWRVIRSYAGRARYLEVFLTQQTQFCKNLFCKRNIHSWLTLRNTHSGQCWNQLVGVYPGTEEYSQEAQSFHPVRTRALRGFTTTVCQKNPGVDALRTSRWVHEDFFDPREDCAVFAEVLTIVPNPLPQYSSQKITDTIFKKKNVKQIYFSVVYQVNLILSTDIFSQFSISGSSHSKAFSCPSLTAMHSSWELV